MLRKDRSADIARIVADAAALDISHERLALEAGLAISTWRRMRKTGLARRPQIDALNQALRRLKRAAHGGVD